MGGSGAARGLTIAVGVISVAPLTWAVLSGVGDYPGATRRSDDYLLDPPEIAGGGRWMIGLTSALLVVVAAFLLVDGIRAGRLRRGWGGAAAAVAGAAGYLGLTYRIASAPVTGANIGGALLLLAGFIVVPALLTVALAVAWRGRQA